LLLLRASVVSALLLQHYDYQSIWIQGFAILLSAALLVGYQTPIIAALAMLFHGLVWARLGIVNGVMVPIVSLDAMVLALLGPGAYSVDSYRFGRRLLVLPPPP
jgi:putative oxidoreductase